MKLRYLLPCVPLVLGAVILRAQDKSPAISFEGLTKDFGKVTEGETLKHIFRFTNKGDATLEIFNVAPS